MDARGAGESRASRRVAIRRLVAYGVIVVTVIVVVAATGLLPSADEARDWGNDLGDFIYVAFVPLFVICNFVITWPILAGAAGLLFGTAVGTPLALAGVTAAGLTQMFVARRLGAGHHGALLPQRTRRIEEFLTEHGAVAVMESRIVPVLPFGIVNFSAGLTRMPYRALAIGTIVGAAPKVFAYVALGGSLSDPLGSPEAVVAIVLLVALALVGALLVRRRIALGGA
jgi:uncharacterized membrane protein YdjX (TVP38/TMEM64 family)